MDLERIKLLNNEYENQPVFSPEELNRFRKATSPLPYHIAV